jgi:hypothetical protein
MAISREDAVAWSTRWRLVSGVVDRERREQSAAARLEALQRLRSFAGTVSLRREPSDESLVWERFQALRQRLGCGERRRHA